MTSPSRRSRVLWLLGTIGLLALGVLIGIILSNVWLGLIIAAIVSLGWLFAIQSRRGHNQGVNDEDHGIEL